jgi:hypothetical protein
MSASSSDIGSEAERNERLEFALRARSEIQRTLFELYKFLRAKPEILHNRLHRQGYQLIVGAAFSLWRAIFLAEADREWASLAKSMESFFAQGCY